MDYIIFFDGVCNLCNNSVNKLIKMDVKKVFKFASLQGEFARSFVPDHLINHENFDTILFYKNGQKKRKKKASKPLWSHPIKISHNW
jgi:predicted DCC family thiol-disulfide oxidoreductase YuxK